MATTKYIVNNLSGQTIDNQPILPLYKVYTALLTQSGDGASTQTTGDLIIGARYIITTYVSDDDFTSVANVISGTINTDGCEFIAIGTTPDNYLNGSTLTDTGAPVATVLENTLGVTPTWYYDNQGNYHAEALGVFTLGKTVIVPGVINFTALNNSTPATIDNVYILTIGIGLSPLPGPDDNLLSNTFIEIRVYN